MLTILLLLSVAAVLWKDAHPSWKQWQKRYNMQPGVAAVPIQIRALVPTRSNQPELCVTCHVGIEDISASHPAQVMGCVVCHGGESLALDKDRAHSTMRGGRNPSDLSVAVQSCGQPDCHAGYADPERNHVDRVLKSIQATYAGGIAHVRFAFGVQKTPQAYFGTHAIVDASRPLPAKALPGLEPIPDPSGSTNEKFMSCVRGGCHLRTLPGNLRPYQYRSLGCAACHYLYADDGLYRGTDTTVPHNRPGHGIAHRFTAAIPFAQCNHCHNRGNYSLQTMTFDWREDLPPALRPLSEQTNPAHRRLIEYYQPIGEFTRCEYELDCVDCHTAEETMGNGHIYGSKKDVRYIQCQTCHGTKETKPATREILEENELAMRRGRMNGHPDFLKVGDYAIVTSRGEVLWSVKEIAKNQFVQIGKATGKIYPVPLVSGSQCKQDGREQASDYCHRCHSVSRY